MGRGRTAGAAGLGLFVMATMSTTGSGNGIARAEDGKPVVGRSVVATKYGIVAASQPLAARAGVQILEHGGNAVDAAIAANATIGLMEPTGNGLGGDLFAIVYWAKTGEILGLNSSGWAPSGLTVELLASKGIETMPHRGIYSVTVPGVVAGWDALRSRLGNLPFADILAPAIFYAEQGFPLSEVIAKGWARSEELLAEHPNSRKTYLVDGHAPRAGDVFKNPDLAASLRRIARNGRDGYYKGETAEAILEISKETGGVFTASDLEEFQPEWVKPLTTTYRGWNVYEIGPNTQGIAALMMLNLMERFPLSEYGFHSANALHVMIEAKKLAYADMLRYVGDPKFSPVPVEAMLDKTHAAERAKRIDLAKAACTVTPSELRTITDAEGGDTIYMSVIDKDGNIVSLIQSNYSGFGSGLVPPGTGFMLQNRGALFTMERDRPNTLKPRKRPLHTIIPAFMEKDGVRIGFGIMGGWNQAQAHAQFVADVADFGMTIQQALEAGRFTKGTFDGCDLDMETLVPEPVRAELTLRGHVIEVAPPRTGGFGFGQAVMSTPDGVHYGASEPRHDGEAIPEAPPVSTSESQAGKPLTLNAITGVEWLLEKWNGDEPAPANPPVTLSYEGGRFVGSGGCNRYFAGATEGRSPGDVTVGAVGATRMFCPDPASEVEARYFKQLAAVRKFDLVMGRLTLSYELDGKEGTMVFRKKNVEAR